MVKQNLDYDMKAYLICLSQPFQYKMGRKFVNCFVGTHGEAGL